MLLRTDLEQAKAHAKTWESRFERRYGGLYLYELRDDAALVWERGELAGLKALLVSEADDDGRVRGREVADQDAVPQDRFLEVGHIEIPVRDALPLVGEG